MNIVLFGYGKMGHEVERVAAERGHTISQRFDIDNPVSISKLLPADCCIDFSIASCLESNVACALAKNIPVVIGTTGWQDNMNRIRELVAEHNGSLVYGSNFSLGANIVFRLTEVAAKIFNRYDNYDVSIHETHHMMKKDSPSGTAVTLANTILKHIDRKETITTGAASKQELSVSSSRVGSVVGEHTVRFNSIADDIIITHTAYNRSGFALGAVLAAEWIGKKKGMLPFEKLLWEHTSDLSDSK